MDRWLEILLHGSGRSAAEFISFIQESSKLKKIDNRVEGVQPSSCANNFVKFPTAADAWTIFK